jgi:hypothetical protein
MADDPPFRFVDTPNRDAEGYLQRMRTFLGYPEEEIALAEHRLGVSFPAVFRQFLLLMGRQRGELLVGSDLAGLEDFEEFRAEAVQLMAESGADVPLPANAVVFLSHQGYTFAFLIADGSFDSAVHQYTEGDRQASVVAPGFAAFLDAELGLAEQVHRQAHERGGYYLTVAGKSVTRTYPALDIGDRPLEA